MLYKVSALLASGLLYRLAERRRGSSEHQIFSSTKLDHMNVNKLPYEAPLWLILSSSLQLLMDICVQFSGDCRLCDFEEGEAL